MALFEGEGAKNDDFSSGWMVLPVDPAGSLDPAQSADDAILFCSMRWSGYRPVDSGLWTFDPSTALDQR
ncbi:MAG: hypothetical protein ISN28_16205 [Ectothiorhodospiraceae bacterium AqS1]|nr:hypothetical protein [Ectothiorhodospiraceae bacterium AqS1]MBF2761777.1 hypothetical protein [Ectothiorhodospiraceae bacterium AqS1]